MGTALNAAPAEDPVRTALRAAFRGNDDEIASRLGMTRDEYRAWAPSKADAEAACETLLPEERGMFAEPVLREVSRQEFRAVIWHPEHTTSTHPLVRMEDPQQSRHRAQPEGLYTACWFVGAGSRVLMGATHTPLTASGSARYFLTSWGHADEERHQREGRARNAAKVAVAELREAAAKRLSIAMLRKSKAHQDSNRNDARFAARGGLSR